MPDTTQVPAASLLDTWVSRDWSDGLQLQSVEDFSEIRVRTRNSVYEIVVIDHQAREILIRGGKFFPERTSAHLAGSSCRGSFLKIGSIHVGFNMEIVASQGTIVTSTVQSVDVINPKR